MRNSIGLLILAFMLCGCGKNIDSIDKVVSVSGNDAVGYDSLEDKSSVSNDGISDCDSIEIDKCSYRSNWLDEYLQTGLVVSWYTHEKHLLTSGIDKDSYICKFIMNEYSVEFDEEAYIEKINEQLPEECVHIYDSDIYLDGTLEDMIKQYSEYLGYPDKIYVQVAFLKNDTCNGVRLRFVSYSRELNDLYIWLMENDKGLEVTFVSDYSPCDINGVRVRVANYDYGFLRTMIGKDGQVEYYFTYYDSDGNFNVGAMEHYESGHDFGDTADFDAECEKYVEQLGMDYNNLVSENTGYLGYKEQHANLIVEYPLNRFRRIVGFQSLEAIRQMQYYFLRCLEEE